MTDDQFEKFMNHVTQKQADHDLLVEINTIVRLNHASYESDKIDNAKKLAVIEKIGTAAHRRIDVMMSGVLITVGSIVVTVIIFFFNAKPHA